VRNHLDVVDQFGNMVPNADDLMNFEISGPAKLIGVENGDILDLSPHKVSSRKVFNGKCILLIQATDQLGEIKVKATSGTLSEAVVKIQAE